MPGTTTSVFRSCRNSGPRCRRQALSPSSGGPVKRWALLFLDLGVETIGLPRPALGRQSPLVFPAGQWQGLEPLARDQQPLLCRSGLASQTAARHPHHHNLDGCCGALWQVRGHDRPRWVASEQGRHGSFATSYAILAAAHGWGHIRAGASPSDLRCGELVRNTRRWSMSKHPSGRGGNRAKVYIVASYTLSLPSSLVFISISSLYFLSLRHRDSIFSGSRPFASLLPTFVSPIHRSERLVRSTLFSPPTSVVSIS